MIAIMQPTFLPWLGYFEMMRRVERFVLLDSVQFERRSWQSRNRIKLGEGEHFLSLCLAHAPQKTPINKIELMEGGKWRERLVATFHHAYARARFVGRYEELLKEALKSYDNLADFNIFLIKNIAADLGVKTPLIRSSELSSNGKREGLLANICEELGAKKYLSPEGSKNYLNKDEAVEVFKQMGVEIFYFNDYTHPVYEQVGGGFIGYLSAVDYLVQNGPVSGEKIVGGGVNGTLLPWCFTQKMA